MIENPHTNRTGIIMMLGVVAVIAICFIVIIFGYKEPETVTAIKETVSATEKSLENETSKSADSTDDVEYTGKYQKSGKLEKIMKQIAEKTETTATDEE